MCGMSISQSIYSLTSTISHSFYTTSPCEFATNSMMTGWSSIRDLTSVRHHFEALCPLSQMPNTVILKGFQCKQQLLLTRASWISHGRFWPERGTIWCWMIMHREQWGRIESNLEGKIDGEGGIVTQHATDIAAPQGQDAFILGDPHNTIQEAFIARVLAVHDHHVAVLGLQEQLGPLHRSHDGVRHPAHERPHHQVLGEVGPCYLLRLHLVVLQGCLLPRPLQLRGDRDGGQLEQRRQGAHPCQNLSL